MIIFKIMNVFFITLLSFILFGVYSCKSPSDQENNECKVADTLIEDDSLDKSTPFEPLKYSQVSALELTLLLANLKDVQQLDSTLMVDLKYASQDNFLGVNMYGELRRAYLQEEVAKSLVLAHEYLIAKYPHLRFYIFDAVRPVRVQQMMWDALDTIPVNQRVKFVSNPKNGSIHNYGAAVDLSIYNLETDTLLDMGAAYDDLREIAYPKYESHFLENGLLTETQLSNRKLLRKAMRVGGFWVLPTEWWHFNRFNRYKAKELFEPIN